MHPIVAIVGRPNVGKSRLFNRIVGHTKAIVSDMPGVTRDRHYAQAEWIGREFICVDTGGLDLDKTEKLKGAVSEQSLKAAAEADVVICVFDGQVEAGPQDADVVKHLRKMNANVVYAVNKVDEELHGDRVNRYYEFGASPLFAISAEHGRQVDDLLEEVVKHFPPVGEGRREETGRISVAVMGRPNVGKSTLINRLAGEERVVAHELAGTTRDAIDVEVDFDEGRYLFIDTAGVKRKWAMSERLEKFTAMRSLKTVNRANIICLLIDGTEGLTKHDNHLIGFARDEGKGTIILVNKWDAVGIGWDVYSKEIRMGLGEGAGMPLFPISALKGTNCLKIFSEIDRIGKALTRKISTSKLNAFVEKALEEHHMPAYKNKEVRINYATQVDVNPPTFALFCNLPAAVPYTYRRYLIRRLQSEFGLEEIPVRLVCRKK